MMNDEHKIKIQNYFDEITTEYEDTYDKTGIDSLRAYIFLSRKNKVLSMINSSGGRILDIGCGPAVLANELVKSGYEVWGIDISRQMVMRANRKVEQQGISGVCHFAVGDIEKLNFPDGYFDCVVCAGVLEYLKDDSEALKEIRRVLKSGGKAIFTIPNIASPFSLIDKLIALTVRACLKVLEFIKININVSKNRLLFRSDIIDRYYLPWRFHRKLFINGFRIEKTLFHIYRLAFLNAIFPSCSLSFSKKLEILSRTPFHWMGINYIVKAYKA